MIKLLLGACFLTGAASTYLLFRLVKGFEEVTSGVQVEVEHEVPDNRGGHNIN